MKKIWGDMWRDRSHGSHKLSFSPDSPPPVVLQNSGTHGVSFENHSAHIASWGQGTTLVFMCLFYDWHIKYTQDKYGGWVKEFNSFQSLSRVRLFVTPWITAHQASLSITNSRSLLKLMSIESVMPSSRLILCRCLLLLPLIPPRIRVFSNDSTVLMRWPKYWSFSFSISPSSEHPGLISFRMDWLDLLAVQGTLKSLLQHRSSKA